MNAIRIIVAAVVFLVGALWIGQGLGMIGGGFMSGNSFWAVVGAILVVIAAALAWTTLRSGRAERVEDQESTSQPR